MDDFMSPFKIMFGAVIGLGLGVICVILIAKIVFCF